MSKVEDALHSRNQLLEALCTESVLSNPAWVSSGVSVAQLIAVTEVPMTLSELSRIQSFEVNHKTGLVRLKGLAKQSPSKKRPNEEKPAEAKRTKPPEVLVSEEQIDKLEKLVLADYLTHDYISEVQAHRANLAVSNLQRSLEVAFLGSIEISVHIVGSYSYGLASRRNSPVDVLIRMEGVDCMEESQENLTEAILAALENCPSFAYIRRSDECSIECVLDDSLRLNVECHNARTFPVSWLIHSRMLASLSRSSPVFPLLVSFCKTWTQTCGLVPAGYNRERNSRHPYTRHPPNQKQFFKISNRYEGKHVLRSFEWTLLVAAFLVHQGSLTSPYKTWKEPSAVREQYGPTNHHLYTYLPNRQSEYMLPPRHYGNIIVSFLAWLAHADLLTIKVSLDGLFHTHRTGWFNIVDPVTGNYLPKEHFKHKHAIRYSQSIKYWASHCLLALK